MSIATAIGDRISTAEYRALLATGKLPGAGGNAGRRHDPEEALHMACIEWAMCREASYPVLKWLVHVPNGGKRSKAVAGKLKAMGTKKGVPDLTCHRSCGQWKGLAIELKAPKKHPSADQEDWLRMFHSEGYLAGLAWSLEDFIELVTAYVTGSQLSTAAAGRLQPSSIFNHQTT